ncbi:MAG: NnrS family protein [Burkholderiaceae bacterium]|nr:NnrS family protein [Burkholderiaceae bacterium]
MKSLSARGGLVPLLEPEPTVPQRGRNALFRLAFRPFYLLAALWAALAVPLWIAQFAGVLPPPLAYPAMLWHAHEMTFGFALAVIVGFLLTAGRAWTGLPTPTGARLAGLAALWVAARVFNYTGPSAMAMLLDAAFIVASMLAIGVVLLKARNYRNLFVLAVLTAFLVANSLFHLAVAGRIDVAPLKAVRFFVFVIVVLTCVIGGRVIPTFTANALRGVRQWKDRRLDWASLALTAFALLLALLPVPAGVVAAACFVAASLQAARLAGWNPWATRRTPILWVLHLSYAWIPAGLVLLALGALGVVPESAGVHALTLGAIGGLIIGMITRTALGHTARPLKAEGIETTAYALVHLAVLLRLAPMLVPALPYLSWTTAAASAWSLAFVVYLLKYVGVLTSPRLDGRDG